MFIVAPFIGSIIAAVIYFAIRFPMVVITTRKPGEQIDRIA
jgi:hypothetical protein